MRIGVYGVGAVGGAIAAALVEARKEVIGIARGGMLAALQDAPLTVRTPGGDFSAAIPVAAGPEGITFGPDDAILLTMKSQDTEPALKALRAAGVTDQPIFCFQNGITNEDLALRYFPNVYGATVMMPVSFLTAGEVIANGAPKIGLFDIGRYPAGLDNHARTLAEVMDGPRLGAFLHDDVMASKRGKLLMNVVNVIGAATGPGFRGSQIADDAVAEARAVFTAAGLAWDDVGVDDPRRKALMQVRDVDGATRSGSSTVQSLMRGTGSVETDYLNGEIARLGRLHGVETPVNTYLARLGAELAARGAAPGAMTLEELSQAVRP